MQAPGIEIRPIKQINGLSGFNEVFFTDVRVPDTNRVGAVNDGWRGALTTLMNERHSIGGGGAGGPDFADLLQLAKETDGGTAARAIEDDAVRQRLARFYIRLKGLQYTSYRTQTALSRGQTPGPESSIGKLVGAPLRQEMASFAIDLQGVAGAMSDRERAPDDGRLAADAISARPDCAWPAAPTRSCATSSPSACSACRPRSAPTRASPSRTCRPARRISEGFERSRG